MKKANAEKWNDLRAGAYSKGTAAAQQKTADAAAENATIAADLKKRLLLRLKRTEEKFPMDATEVKVTEKNKTVIFRLRDLTAAFRDITGDMDTVTTGNELLHDLGVIMGDGESNV